MPLRITTLFLVTLALTACASAPQKPALSAASLNGTWDVEMYYSPSEPPSTTVMVLKPGEGDALTVLVL